MECPGAKSDPIQFHWNNPDILFNLWSLLKKNAFTRIKISLKDMER